MASKKYEEMRVMLSGITLDIEVNVTYMRKKAE